MITLVLLLLLIALGCTIASAAGRCPLWAAVFILVVANLIAFWGGR